MESAADKLSILQESVNAFFIRFFDGMYPNREDRDPDLVKLKRIGSLNQFNGVDKDYSDIDIKMDIIKAFTYIVEHGDGIDELKEDKNIPFEDSVERISFISLILMFSGDRPAGNPVETAATGMSVFLKALTAVLTIS